MVAPNILRELYFLPAGFFSRRGNSKKSQGLGLHQENKTIASGIIFDITFVFTCLFEIFNCVGSLSRKSKNLIKYTLRLYELTCI